MSERLRFESTVAKITTFSTIALAIYFGVDHSSNEQTFATSQQPDRVNNMLVIEKEEQTPTLNPTPTFNGIPNPTPGTYLSGNNRKESWPYAQEVGALGGIVVFGALLSWFIKKNSESL